MPIDEPVPFIRLTDRKPGSRGRRRKRPRSTLPPDPAPVVPRAAFVGRVVALAAAPDDPRRSGELDLDQAGRAARVEHLENALLNGDGHRRDGPAWRTLDQPPVPLALTPPATTEDL